MRKKYVIANFKMNKVDSEIDGYLSTLLPLISNANCEVGLAVPSVSIKTTVQRVKGSNIIVAGQNLNENNFGAYTGEINAEMKEHECSDPTLLGATARIIGAIETFYDANGKTEQSFLSLMNPFGAFISLQQGMHRILRGAIVNQKQLDALLESVDELFNNVEKEHQQGLKYVYKEKGL